jgi:hypothetical protein
VAQEFGGLWWNKQPVDCDQKRTDFDLIPLLCFVNTTEFREIVMADKTSVFYPHRANKDGTFDSICLRCFATVARTREEAELVAYDASHVCDYSMLSTKMVIRERASKSGMVKQENPPWRDLLREGGQSEGD